MTLFIQATYLFKAKWLEYNGADIESFLDYFRDNQAQGDDIKACGNIKQRTICKRFLNDIGIKHVEDWSLRYRNIFENGNINSIYIIN